MKTERSVAGYVLEWRFKYKVSGDGGETWKESWTQWQQYWTHKIYHHKDIVEEAIKQIKKNTNSDAEFRYYPVYKSA